MMPCSAKPLVCGRFARGGGGRLGGSMERRRCSSLSLAAFIQHWGASSFFPAADRAEVTRLSLTRAANGSIRGATQTRGFARPGEGPARYQVYRISTRLLVRRGGRPLCGVSIWPLDVKSEKRPICSGPRGGGSPKKLLCARQRVRGPCYRKVLDEQFSAVVICSLCELKRSSLDRPVDGPSKVFGSAGRPFGT